MRLVTLALLFTHFILAPLANATIKEHIEVFHKESLHTRVFEHSHNHGNNHTAKSHSEDNHKHALIDLEEANLNDELKLETPLYSSHLIFLALYLSNPYNLKTSNFSLKNQHLLKFTSPDTFRNLPLLI